MWRYRQVCQNARMFWAHDCCRSPYSQDRQFGEKMMLLRTDLPPTTKHYWVTDTDTSLLKPAPVQRQESNNIKRSLCSPNWSLSVPATAVTFSMEWEKPFYKLYFLTQRKLSSCLVKQMPWKRGLVHAALCNFGIFFFPWRALPWRLQVTGVGVPLAQLTPPTGSVCTLPEGLWSRTGQPQ